MTHPEFNSRLSCPRCDVGLTDQDNGLHCKGCQTRYPLLDGIPFLFAEPGVALDEWRQRYHARLRDVEQQAQQLGRALAQPDLLDATRARLTHEQNALATHSAELTALLASLDTTTMAADHATYLAMRTRLPSDQGLVTYYANLHRDWCWGDDENAQSVQLVKDAMSAGGPGDLLVLGAGGGRLAYDLHAAFDHPLTVALDFNPLLMIAAARVAAGATVPLHEFPIAPGAGADVAIARELAAPSPTRDGLHWVLANALRAPFASASFDTLVTPWLIDVIGEPLDRQAQRWNRLLRPGGQWIWFGSHVFRNADPLQRLSPEESMQVIAQNGFADVELIDAQIPYMASPGNRHARQEQVIVMRMTKTHDVDQPPRHVALPDWLVRADTPVPVSESFQQQGMASRIHGFFFSMVDGKRTLQDMAVLMEQERLMPQDEGVAALRNFFIRALEESEGYTTF
ncbi:MAG: methyltransferase domain-containing protein [Pseudomonadota bacterium]